MPYGSTGERLVAASRLVVDDPGAAVRALHAPSREMAVRDGDGTRVATVRRDERDAKPLRTVFRVVGSLFPLVSPPRRWQVLDADGAPVLALAADGTRLTVADAFGNAVGEVRNATRLGDPATLRVELHDAQRGRRGTPVATMAAKGEPARFALDVRDEHGAEVGRVVAADSRTTLDVGDGVADPVRTLLVAFVCGTVDDGWLRAPPHDA